MAESKFERVKGLALPTLPPSRSWRTKEFLNNELQAHEPGSHVTFFVEGEARVLGLPVRWRDETYPAYVIDLRKDDAYFMETAQLMMSQHQEYLLNHNERAL